MIDVRDVPLGPAAILPANATLADAWLLFRTTGLAIAPVGAAGSGAGAVLESAVRRALQDQRDPQQPIARIADAALRVPSRAAAEHALGADPSLGAVLFDAADGPLAVERVVPVVRDAIVMAGGFGTRLRPLTDTTPKPLLDVGGRPLLCRILDQLRDAGIERVHVSVHYLADQVKALVGDGSAWGLRVRYLEEDRPLGTGAGLALLGAVDGPFLVMNGDVLTDVSMRAFTRHHHLANNLATVATYLFAAPLPYGVVHHDGDRIARIEEKPVYRYPVNAGLYVFSPTVLELVEHGQPLAMVDFLNLHVTERRIGRFPLVEYWNDVGSMADYERARQEVHTL